MHILNCLPFQMQLSQNPCLLQLHQVRNFVLIKVFRLLRKTFLLFYCFFFIKVFRFQRKTLLLLFAFSFFIIKVFRFQRKTFLLFYCFFFSIIIILLHYYFSYRFCPEDFSETVRWISVKFSGLIVSYKSLIYFFLF